MPNEAPLSITSLQNPRIKNVVKLRQRSHRDSTGTMIIEGSKELSMALDNNFPILELYVCKDRINGDADQELISRILKTNTECIECSPAIFEKISYRENPQGLLAVARCIANDLSSFTPPDRALIIIAEAVEKPGNLGTILRSADAAGAHAVIICDRCTDINNPNVIRASLGTVFALPVLDSSSEECLAWLNRHNVQTIAATPSAETNYTEIDCRPSTAVIVGSEHEGLSTIWLENTDHQAKIPMLGQADSLNVAASATILLYEILRQRSA